MTIEEAFEPISARVLKRTGLRISGSRVGSMFSAITLANESVAIELSYDIRDRWLNAKVMRLEDAERLTEARASRSFEALALHDGAINLYDYLAAKSNSKSMKMGPLSAPKELPRAVKTLLGDFERYGQDVIDGTEQLPPITPAELRITRHSPKNAPHL